MFKSSTRIERYFLHNFNIYRKRNYKLLCSGKSAGSFPLACSWRKVIPFNLFFSSQTSSVPKPHLFSNLFGSQTPSPSPKWTRSPWSMRSMRNISTTIKRPTTTPLLRENVGTAARFSSSRAVGTSRIAYLSVVKDSTSSADDARRNHTLAVAAPSLLVS